MDERNDRTSRRQRDVEAYARRADSYERRWRRYLQATHGRAFSGLTATSRTRILDVACGTGRLLRELPRHLPGGDGAPELVGIDLTADMLHRADRESAGLVRGNMQQLPFQDASFDLTFCISGLHFAPRPEQALREIARVTRTTGEIRLITWRGEDWFMRVAELALHAAGRGHAPALRSARISRMIADNGLTIRQRTTFRSGLRWALCYWLLNKHPTVARES